MERLPSFRGSAFGNSRESCKSDRPALRGIGRTVLPRRFPPVPLDGHGRGEEAWTRPGRRRAIRHGPTTPPMRPEEHTSELQSLMRISYAVFCLKKKIKKHNTATTSTQHKRRKRKKRH